MNIFFARPVLKTIWVENEYFQYFHAFVELLSVRCYSYGRAGRDHVPHLHRFRFGGDVPPPCHDIARLTGFNLASISESGNKSKGKIEKMRTRLGWAEMKSRLQNAVLLSAVAMFVSLPMFYERYTRFAGSIFKIPPTAEQLFYLSLSQSFMVLAIAFLSALVGFLYMDRLRLPGFGRFGDIRIWLPAGLVVGLAITPVAYYAADREIISVMPEVFPSSWQWALANMAGGAIAQEVIARMGLLTIALYFMDRWKFKGHPWPAIIFVSLFGAAGSFFSLAGHNLAGQLLPNQIILCLVLAFAGQWVFCEIFIRKGFIPAAGIHFGMSVKYLVYSVTVV